ARLLRSRASDRARRTIGHRAGSAAVTSPSIPNMAQSGGTATGSFTITGTDIWSGGDITGSGTTTVASSATLNATGSVAGSNVLRSEERRGGQGTGRRAGRRRPQRERAERYGH